MPQQPAREFLHKNGTVVLIDEQHRFGVDALLLAAFSDIKREWTLLDLGTGTGILPLALYDAGYRGNCVALDISPRAAAIAKQAAELNGLEQMTVLCTDLRSYTAERKFDAVICNPPYFSSGWGLQNEDGERRTARHETDCTLADAVAAARRNLKEGGRLCMCHRPERLGELLSVMRENRLEPKRLQLVKHDPSGKPWLVLVDARLGRNVGLDILPDVITPKKQLSAKELEAQNGG